MNKTHKILWIVFIASITNTPLFATSSEKSCDKTQWSCHGSFYIGVGYLFDHVFYKNDPLTLAVKGDSTIAYTPNAEPQNFNGMRLSFGSGLGQNTPFYYELGYNQRFVSSKTSDLLRISAAGKSVTANLGYYLNPESRLRVALLGGAIVTSSYLTITPLFPQDNFSSTTNSVDVDPLLGGSLRYQLTSTLGLKAAVIYDIATYNREKSGSIITLVALNYYPSDTLL